MECKGGSQPRIDTDGDGGKQRTSKVRDGREWGTDLSELASLKPAADENREMDPQAGRTDARRFQPKSRVACMDPIICGQIMKLTRKRRAFSKKNWRMKKPGQSWQSPLCRNVCRACSSVGMNSARETGRGPSWFLGYADISPLESGGLKRQTSKP